MQSDANNNTIPYFRKTQNKNMQLSRFLDFCNTNTKTLIRYLFKLVFDQKNTKEVD